MNVPFPERPKGMHLETYIPLWLKSRRLGAVANARVEAWFQACKARRTQSLAAKQKRIRASDLHAAESTLINRFRNTGAFRAC